MTLSRSVRWPKQDQADNGEAPKLWGPSIVGFGERRYNTSQPEVMMDCPACSGSLTTPTFEGIALYVCAEGYGGVWFDQFEFRMFRFITPSYYIPGKQDWGAY